MYAPLGLYMRPMGPVCPLGAHLCPMRLKCTPPPPMYARHGTLLSPLRVHLCPLGLFYAPWGSSAPPPHPCAPPFSRARPSQAIRASP
jgi:hypothetical protein